MSKPLLSVHDLHVHFPKGPASVRAVDGVSFDLAAGEALAIVGETGSGKTSIGRALLGLHPPGSMWGSIRLAGRELDGLSEEAWRPLRWRHIAMAVQSAGTAFDPVYRIGEQIAEPLREHLGLSSEATAARAAMLAPRVGLEPRHLRAYPHQLSGGERQRAMLAMALSCEPQVLIVDEPTSGQDVLSRARLIDLLREVREEAGMSLILISHDLAAAALRKHFGARELTPDWFRDRLLSHDDTVFRFAVELLPKVHTHKSLGVSYFREIIDDARLRNKAAAFALDALSRFPLLDGGTKDSAGLEFLRRVLLHPLCTRTVTSWLEEERNMVNPTLLDYIKIYYDDEIPDDWQEYDIKFYDYDWSLNDFDQ